ncbi:MAG: 50S ribosomal protein L29 [Peptococcaceae bacterium]|mgnify:FL=1|jgi:large subunit ribosomal protein L29|nr:50S ribosomal protein L29 [Peptococcaceae bacterium]MBQ2034315.1 50S ribosomal protein L29 [Peptococcaceae bacterium]MBQ2119334.1 50S ribosomal protein L29 [Peptococcaceae bacterium]MBQ2448940.1 50S ribosomal protein L29 [Peptococcaceae bacterium]MBQ3509645.1 50S ribosomal protein L29 [Peptococcaceae bacterium]
MKVKVLRDLSTAELEKKVVDLKEELFNLRFQMATGQLENPMKIKEIRKDIAKAKTVLREREIKEQA